MSITSDSTGLTFITTELVDFSDVTEREVSVYERNEFSEPVYYLIKKYVNVISEPFSSIFSASSIFH